MSRDDGGMLVNLAIGLIDDGARIRALSEDVLHPLMLSMGGGDRDKPEKNLAQPILVRPMPGGRYVLVVGRHRLEAARRLGWPEIDAVVKNLSDDQASMYEVDENLYRPDLSETDKTFFVNKKLELYTFSGKKFSRGRDLRKGANLAPLEGDAPAQEVIRFYSHLEANFGIKSRTAKRLGSRLIISTKQPHLPDRWMRQS